MSKFTEGFSQYGDIFTPSSGVSGAGRGRFGRGFTGRAKESIRGWTEKNRPSGITQDPTGNVHIGMESRLDQFARNVQSAAQVAAIALPFAAAGLAGIARARQQGKANRAAKRFQAQQLKLQKAQLKAAKRNSNTEARVEQATEGQPFPIPNQVLDTSAAGMFGLTPQDLQALRAQYALLDRQGKIRNAAHMPVSGVPVGRAVNVGH